MTALDFDETARVYLATLPTLEAVTALARAVVFVGRTPEGARVFLEMSRPFHMQRSFNPDEPGQPVGLHVMEGTKEAPTGRGYAFALHEDAPAGREVLAQLEALNL